MESLMSYFSRLTDIVTCNLTQLLKSAEDPRAAIREIVAEMREGLAGAQRSVATAAASAERLQQEVGEHRSQVAYWTDKARQAVADGDDPLARQALLRKREMDDLIGGLEQQHHAAVVTREHLATMHRALEARLAEALRKQQELEQLALAADDSSDSGVELITDDRARQIEDELEALRKELGK
jgi:phage shock protein A